MQRRRAVTLESFGSLRRAKRPGAVRRAAGRVVEALEDRTLFAWNLTLAGGAGSAPTTNVSAGTVAGTTTFTADGTGANLNWNDVYSALAAGENVVINSGSTGAEAGNITDTTGYQLKPLSGSNLNLTVQSGSGSGLVGNISIANVTLDGTQSSVILDANGSVSTGYLGGGTLSNPVPLASARITAANGSINSQSFPFIGPVDATMVALRSSTGIGSTSDWLWTETSYLSALTSTGGMYISNSGSLTLNDGVLPGVNGVHVTTSGDINLSVAGNLTIDTNGDNVSGPGNDSLETFGGGNILLGGNNGNSFDSFTGAVASTGGTVTLKAAGNLLVGDTSNGTYGNIEGGGNISLVAGGNISIDNGSVVSAHGTGTITATAGGNLSVLHTDSFPTILATQGGAIALSTGAGGTLTVDGAGTFYGNQHTIFTTRNGGNGNITIHADHFALDLSDDDIVAGTGTVSIQPVTASEAIQLGTPTDAELDLSNLELMRITAGTLQVGSMADTGGISITAPVSAFNAATLTLMTGGSILDAAPSDYLAGNNLALEVGGSIGTPAAPISTGVRNIAVRAINSTGGVAVTNSSTNLNVGFASEPFYGVSSDGDVSLTNQGGLSVTDHVTSIGTITLNALGPTSDISVASGNVSADKGVVAHADRDVLVSGPGGIISSASGSIGVTAGRDVVVNNSSQITTDFGLNGSVSVSAGRNLTIESTAGGKNTLIATSTGSINLATGPGGVFTLDAAAGAQVSKFNPYGPGNITISADDMVIDDPIYAGRGVVTLQQASTAARSIDLGMGTTAGALDLSSAELSGITAQILRLGRTDNPGDVLVTGPVMAPLLGYGAPGTISLMTGGAVIEANAAGPEIAAPNLAVRSASGASFDAAVSNLAFYNTTSGGVSIRNRGPLTIAPVDGLTSSSNLGSGTTLGDSGAVTFAANTTSTGTLVAVATDTAAGRQPDGNLTINGGVLVQSTEGDVDLTAGGGISLGTGSRLLAPLGNISLTAGAGGVANAGPMTLNGNLATGGALTLNIPPTDSATLTGTASAAQVLENGGGSLFVNGPTGSINAVVRVNAGTLGGTGTISGTTAVAPGATLAPGNRGPGILTTGTETLSGGSTFSVQLGGPVPGNTAGSYGQLDANGDVNLNDATLAAALAFAPGSAQTFTIIQAAGSISGQFAQGSFVVVNGITYSIEYLPHSVVLAAPADLSVSISGPTSAIEGSAASYVYSVANAGPGAAQDVMLSAPIPDGAVFLSASFGGGFVLPASAYNASTGVVNLGTVAAGSSGTLTLNVRLPEENPGVTFEAGLASITGDPNVANNTASVTTIVRDAPLSARGRTVSQGGKSFTNVTVATFSDANLAAAASDFTANINWGDGTVSSGQVVANGDGTFSVIASHAYKDAKYKSYSLAVQIVDAGGSTASVTSTAIVIPRPVRRP